MLTALASWRGEKMRAAATSADIACVCQAFVAMVGAAARDTTGRGASGAEKAREQSTAESIGAGVTR